MHSHAHPPLSFVAASAASLGRAALVAAAPAQRIPSAARAPPLPPTTTASSICPADIPDNLNIDDFVERYDRFVAFANIPALGYTTDVFSGPGGHAAPLLNGSSVSDDNSDDGEGEGSDTDRGTPFTWPGQGTTNCEDPNILAHEPREDDYYLQFGDLTPTQFGVGGNQRCWVSYRGRKVAAVVVETYFLLCQINNSSSGKSRRPSKINLYHSVADRDGNEMGYVSSGRVRIRYSGWSLDKDSDGGESVIDGCNVCLFIHLKIQVYRQQDRILNRR
jgi:hypothetical protein